MSSLIDHVEKYLGKIQYGWSRDADGHPLPFQVAKCEAGSTQRVVSYVTLGLSDIPLASMASEKSIRHELLLRCASGGPERNLPALLQQVAAEAIRKGRAFLRGEVIGPRGRMFEGKEFEGFFVTGPSCLDEEFAIFRSSAGCEIVMAWLIPVTRSELVFISERGWVEFEDELAAAEVDPSDLNRASIL